MPDRFTTWTPAIVNRVAWALVAISVLARALVTSAGSFYWDDFILQGRSARLPLDGGFLLYNHDGHVMPGALAVAWLTERVSPLGYAVPVATMVGLQAAIAVCAWLVIRAWFGTRPLVLVPLALYVFSPMTLPSAVWWAAALNALPLQLAMLGIAWGALLLYRQHRTRAGTLVILTSVVLALAFFEKSLLLALWLPGLAWILSEGGLVATAKAQWRHHKALWLPLVGVFSAYLLMYTRVSDRGLSAPEQWGPIAETYQRGIFDTVVPGIFGGPVNWVPAGFASGFAEPPGWVIALSVEVLIVVVLAGCLVSLRARQAWVVAAGYVLAAITLYALGRVTGGGTPASVGAMRYTADALLPLVLAVGLSLMPLRDESESALRNRARDALSEFRLPLLLGSAVAANVFAVLVIISTLGYYGLWSDNPARGWLANARTTMADGANDGPILDQTVPEDVLYGLARPYNQILWLLAPLGEKPPLAPSTNQPRYINTEGRLVPAYVEGIVNEPGKNAQCGWLLKAGTTKIPLDGDAFEWEYRLGLNYLSDRDFEATVKFGSGAPRSVMFTKGLGESITTIDGGGSTLTISDVPPAANVCVSRAAVGSLADRPG